MHAHIRLVVILAKLRVYTSSRISLSLHLIDNITLGIFPDMQKFLTFLSFTKYSDPIQYRQI